MFSPIIFGTRKDGERKWHVLSVLKIIGIVLGALILLVLLLLALPVRIKIKLNEKGKYFFRVMIVFIPLFTNYSGKPEKKKKKKTSSDVKKKSVVSSKFEGLFGLRELFEGGDTAEGITEGIRIITNVLRNVWEMLPGSRVEKLKVTAVFSDSDPAREAMSYGVACAAVYPFIGLIKSFMKVRENGTEVDMRCSFGTEEPSINFEAIVGASVLSLLRCAVKIIMEEAKNAVMKEGNK